MFWTEFRGKKHFFLSNRAVLKTSYLFLSLLGAKSEWDKYREGEKSTVELRRAIVHWCYGSETPKKPGPGEVGGVQISPPLSALEELHIVI